MMFLFAFSGFCRGISGAILENGIDNDAADIILLPFTILLFLWCKEHALLNNIANKSNYRLFVALIAPIGIPYYYLNGFGFKKGIFGIIKSILFYYFLAMIFIIFLSIGNNFSS